MDNQIRVDDLDAPTVREYLTRAGLTINVDLAKGDWTQLPDESPTVDHSKQLGRYTITGHLGAGGMGEVLQVRDEDVGREMAEKVILFPR
ncbi:hypothetical protein JYT15_00895 [Acidimicrobium ferrooxidans]|nr:hypothetical protein [Acidimicrobium ferrooxidans]